MTEWMQGYSAGVGVTLMFAAGGVILASFFSWLFGVRK
jgi:hypothetical protein